MSRVQSRRTISVSRRLLTALREFTRRNDIAVSAFTEFVLEQAIAAPLDDVAFDDWFSRRAHVLAADQRAAALAAVPSERRDAILVNERARDARRAARTARQSEAAARKAAREDAGATHLCSACSGPGHHRSACPLMHGPRRLPSRTFSLSEQAAMFRAQHGVTLADAAARFGVTRQAVQQREAHLRKVGVL